MRIQAEVPSRRHVGLSLSGPPLEAPNTRYWPLLVGEQAVGHISSAVYSPRLDGNIALGMVAADHAGLGSRLRFAGRSGTGTAIVVDKPFIQAPQELRQVFD